MCAQPDVRATFDRLATEYDELKLRVIPGYRQVQDLAVRYASRQPCERVLELGCGTGR
jgi:ubiquinone/menaquinone biosynthesis C-methylase UbiE